MSADPRRDVAQAAQTDPVARLEAQVRELRGQLEALRNVPVQVGNGAPAADPTTLREGAEYLDRTNLRKYWVVNGAWHYAALT